MMKVEYSGKVCSLSAGHPIEDLERIRAGYKLLGLKVRIVYRGPRYDSRRAFTRKEHAVGFSVYEVI